MPYISPNRRLLLNMHRDTAVTVGELNYLITKLIKDFLGSSDRINYAALNAAVGVLDCVKQELYRRIISPYEDKKIEENGDVW